VRVRIRLCNAPATFQRAMDMTLAGIKWQICLLYLDDVIVSSGFPEEHLQHLDEVLTRLGKAGVTLQAAKCHFFQEKEEYLGNVIRSGRVHVLEKNLRALRGLRYPETKNPDEAFPGYVRRISPLRGGLRQDSEAPYRLDEHQAPQEFTPL